MEENSEVHMETDVSSTTEDVPETQEVTGSDGNVEMIIVVEKMDEETDSNDQSEGQSQQGEESTNTESIPDEKSPQRVTPTQKSPAKSPKKSPTKVAEVVTKPSEPDSENIIVVRELHSDTDIEVSNDGQQVALADSSVKESPPDQNEEKPTSDVQHSSKELKQELINKSPIKELQIQNSGKSSPSKNSVLDENTQINGKVQCNDTNTIEETNNRSLISDSIDVTVEREMSNDSQIETMSDTSEKEHNKSISRELKSLINSAKESKIISECTQLTTKTRKSRAALDSSSSSLNSSLLEPGKIDVRRVSDNSQKSNCSEKSDKTPLKRSMRSQNPEFVSKVKQFLSSVTGSKGHKDAEDDEETEEKLSKDKLEPVESPSKVSPPKIKKIEPIVPEKPASNKLRSDSFCWRCHWAAEHATNQVHGPMHCTVCPRSFHYKCLSSSERNKICMEKNWVCPECMIVLHAESSETRSPAMKKISLGMLCDLLRHALERMMDLNGVEPFMQPVDRTAFPDYDKYVVHPMDLSLMKTNIDDGLYGSTEAFLADAQWILHNSIIFNTLQSKLTAGARALVRSCRAEMGEIEACPECYAAAHARRPTWFTDVCSTPHILLWAKLKGFPYWPAKGMSVSAAGMVDVRFFGAHDRAWVPAKDCFLYSEKDPNNFRTKRQDILDSMQEAEQHIRNISRKYGKFVYPPFKTQFDPVKLVEQLRMMIPTFEGELRVPLKDKTSPSAATKEKSRSISKSSKSSINDGDTSEAEDTPVKSRKMADGAEIAKMDDDDSNVQDKDVSMDVETSKTKDSNSRKRRRSEMEEAIITIIETSGGNSVISNEKRKRTENDKKEDKAPENKDEEPNTSKKVEEPQTADNTKTGGTTEEKATDESASNESISKVKDNEPSSSSDKNQRVTPIRIALVTKERRVTRKSLSSREQLGKIITPTKDKEEKTTPQRMKSARIEKAEKTPNSKGDKVEKTPSSKAEKVDKPTPSKPDKGEKIQTPKGDKTEKTNTDKTPKENRSSSTEKRRNSKSNKSSNNSYSKTDKTTEKKSGKNGETNSNDKTKDNNSLLTDKEKDGEGDKTGKRDKQISPKPTENQNTKSVKDRLQFDDDTSLAVLAKTNKSLLVSNNTSGLPTISCVRSLSTTAQNTSTTSTKTTTNSNTTDVVIAMNSNSSVFTSTNTEKTTKAAANKLQRLRNDAEPMVGRVGVRAFARMTSPEKNRDDVQVEIKAEPVDIDMDADRHMEKMDLMNAFRLRPVNPNPPSSLREVRINKVVVTPLNARKGVTNPQEVRPKAKKTFPQPKKPDDGRSELNSKNSMVYIPIQPPMTQAPVRLPRPVVAGASPNAPVSVSPPTPVQNPRLNAPAMSTAANNVVNTVTPPLMHSTCPSSTSSSTSPSSTVCSTVSVATVPTVHTVPLMTSVNGQWMFSFQPVMSVGAIDSAGSPPIMNGVAERTNPAPIVALTPTVGGGPTLPVVPAVSVNSTVTTGLNRTTENLPGEPPRLQQKPTQILLNPLDASTPIGSIPPPSTAGPVTAKLNQNAVKLADFFRNLLEDSLEKIEEPASQLTTLRLQLEQAQWRHKGEIDEIKHNHELTLAEMRASFEKEKSRAISEARRAAQVELEAAVKQAKSKQWCANCMQEAQFYCCWNTSYCDYPCQRAHWAQHFPVCQQRSQDSANGEPPSSPENRLKPQPEMPKTTAAPTLTVGGKVATPRTAQDQNNQNQKASIIVSMVEDTSGNQTMKCVGTYKPSAASQIAPIIINKQLLNNEENSNKKVVASSGGYLIVGATNNSTVVTPARRTHTIQYYT